MTKKQAYDLAIIGGGPGGYTAALHAAERRKRVALIDKRGAVGGTCLYVGCIPSKALLHSSEMGDWIVQRAATHGIRSREVAFDFSVMQKRKEAVVQELAQGLHSLLEYRGVATYHAQGELVDAHTVQVGEEENLTAEHILIATGSEAIPFPDIPFDEQTLVSSTGALSLATPPKSLVVIGAGVIGVELASVYRRLGSEVILVEMLDHVCDPMDGQIRKELENLLTQQGLSFLLSAKVTALAKKNKRWHVEVEQTEKAHSLQADVVLVAIGRRPYTQNLGLEKVGISLTEKGFIPINRHFQTVQSSIYAIGDVVEGAMLAHRASAEGRAVVDHLCGESSSLDLMAIPNIIYTYPEVAALGLKEEEIRQHNIPYRKVTSPFRANARALCNGDAEGFVKILAHKISHQLLGVHMIGPQASELIAVAIPWIQGRNTVHELAAAPIGHPTLAEALQEAAQRFH